jgi:hypothetical protein
LFSPGYRDGRRAAPEPAGDGPRAGGRYGWAGGAAGKGPVRGFPPTPGQPPPLYPPGQFSAWNRTAGPVADGQAGARSEGDPRQAGSHAGPGYSVLAVSDPAADVTSTQTWGAVGDGRETGTWTALRAPDAGLPAPGDGRAAAGDDGRVPTGGHRQPAGHAGRRPGPADRSAQPDKAGVQGTQPSRARGHSTGGHSTGGHSTGGHSTRAGTRKRGKPSRWLLAAGLAVLAAVGTVVFFVVGIKHGGSAAAAPDASGPATTSPAARPSPSPSASPLPPAGQWRYITTRASDPSPLTVAELFPAGFSAGASYTRTVRRNGTDCSAAVVGARLQSAVSRAGCSQVLRASYLSVSKKQMGTIGVLNLKTFSAAERAGKAAGSTQFIAPLDAAKGPTRNLTKAAGLEEAEVKGHYLILVLADFTSLRAPRTKVQRSALEAFMSQLIKETVNVSLTSRMVTGEP